VLALAAARHEATTGPTGAWLRTEAVWHPSHLEDADRRA
jgi:hypothetical protein